MRLKRVSAAIAVTFSSFFLFQNCGQFSSRTGKSNSETSVIPSTISLTGQVQNVNVNPGDLIDLKITLNQPAVSDINFSYSTADNTALSGQHYISTSGSSIIQQGELVGHIAINTKNNPGLVFLDRDFKVQIQVPSLTLNQTVTIKFISGQAQVNLKNLWSQMNMAGSPSPRRTAASVWTGSRMLIWGGASPAANGVLGDGYAYDPIQNSWSPISAVGAPSPRAYIKAVWTGSKMIIWGGTNFLSPLGDGAMYDPQTNSWSPISTVGAPTARQQHSMFWTGSKLIVWGGLPAGTLTMSNDGAMYDPQTNTWTAMSAVGAPSRRIGMSNNGVWTGSKLIIWGGYINADNSGDPNILAPADGAMFDPITNSWSPVSQVNAPSPRAHSILHWTGSKMIVWGGMSAPTVYPNTGGIYDPQTNTWTSLPQTNSPSGRVQAHSAWTGSELVVWGGYNTAPGPELSDGASYNISTGVWTPLSASPLSARRVASSVWTGNMFLIFGGSAIVNAAGVTLGDGAVLQ